MATSVKPFIVKERQQHQRRKGVNYRDQFGRVYHVVIDVDSLAPVGPIELRDERPPVPIPAHYVRPVPDTLGQIECHLEEWRRDLLAAHQAYQRNLRTLARKAYGDQAPMAIASRAPALLDLAGPEPIPVQFVEAQIAGNKWALGMRLGKGFYPQPKWVTRELLDRLELAQRTVWQATDAVDAPPVDVSLYADDAEGIVEASRAASGFEDDDDTETRIRRAVFEDDDELTPAELEELQQAEAVARDDAAAEALEADAEARHLLDDTTPAKRGRGRPRNTE